VAEEFARISKQTTTHTIMCSVEIATADNSAALRNVQKLSSQSVSGGTSSKTAGLPLSFLSLLWLALCTILVKRQNELIAVFFSFVSSFGVALVLLSLGRGTIWRPNSENKSRISLSTQRQRTANAVTKNLVGLLNCVASLLFLCCTKDSGVINSISTTPEFAALSILTGYLAFDLWYSASCYPPPSARLLSVWEDTVTLTVFLVVLAREGGNGLGSFRGKLELWVGYKVVRLVLDLSRGNSHNVFYHSSSPPTQHFAETGSREMQSKSKHVPIGRDYLWTVHGKDYDLRDFVDRHPGGKEAIELGRGRDCSAMFESYHPFTEQHRIVLQKYELVNGKSNGPRTEKGSDLDPFYETLKERVANALRENGLDPNLDRASTLSRAAYYVLILSCLIVSASYHVRGSIRGAFLFAVFGWLIGALGHDGGHFAVSCRPFVNDLSLWGISLLCNPVMWQHQHTYAHHSHTNDYDHDPDLHHFTVFLRVHRRFKHDKIYGLQRNTVFVFFAYAFVVFGTCIKIPLGMIKTGTLYGIVEWTDGKRPLRAFMMLAHYALYIGTILIAPFFSGRPWYVALLAGVTHMATSGILFAIFSQINHLNEHSIETDGSCDLVKTSWAANQVVTSNNFATRSFAWHVLSNGLNLQIEHHLFPGLNHCHLHLIAPTVRQTCEEFGVPYKSYETWSELMGATLGWLDALSVDEEKTVPS